MKGKLLQEVWEMFSEEETTQIKERAQELRQEYLILQNLEKAKKLQRFAEARVRMNAGEYLTLDQLEAQLKTDGLLPDIHCRML